MRGIFHGWGHGLVLTGALCMWGTTFPGCEECDDPTTPPTTGGDPDPGGNGGSGTDGTGTDGDGTGTGTDGTGTGGLGTGGNLPGIDPFDPTVD